MSVVAAREVGGHSTMVVASLCVAAVHLLHFPATHVILPSSVTSVTPVSCHTCRTCLLSLVLPHLPPLCICRLSSRLIQPMPGIPTDSVWEFFSHTAYYNQRAQWVEEVVEGDRHGEVPIKQPQLTRVSNMSGLVDACSLKEF